MIRTALIVAALLTATPALAGDLTVRSRLIPGPGLLQPGTMLNPYVIQDGSGRQVGTIRPRMMDLTPHDGFLDAGTPTNPWVLHTDE